MGYWLGLCGWGFWEGCWGGMRVILVKMGSGVRGNLGVGRLGLDRVDAIVWTGYGGIG